MPIALAGGTKTETKTRHSGTVNHWAAIIFAPFSSIVTVTEVCMSVQFTHRSPTIPECVILCTEQSATRLAIK